MIGALTDGSSRRGRLVARAVMLALVALLSAGRSPAAVTQAGQPGATLTLSGVVRDAANRQPIGAAAVMVNGSQSTTDASGHYSVTVSAGATFRATAVASGYLTTTLLLSTGGPLLSGARTLDFSGHNGLTRLATVPVTITGVVWEALTNKPILGAAVSAGSAQTLTDSSGHYRLVLPQAPYYRMRATALGYAWSPPLTVRLSQHAASGDVIAQDFSGTIGLHPALPASGDRTLGGFQQMVPLSTRTISFAGTARQALDDHYAVTYPDGTAAALPLTITGTSFSGRFDLDKGPGVYHLEINSQIGFPVFTLPLYHGTPYQPPPPLSPARPDPADVTLESLEQSALDLINGVRRQYHLAALVMTPGLRGTAHQHSADVAEHHFYFQHPHIGSDGSTPAQRLIAAHAAFAQAHEDVTLGGSLTSAVESLLISPAHRAHVLAAAFTAAGVGIARDSDGNLVMTVEYVHPAGQGKGAGHAVRSASPTASPTGRGSEPTRTATPGPNPRGRPTSTVRPRPRPWGRASSPATIAALTITGLGPHAPRLVMIEASLRLARPLRQVMRLFVPRGAFSEDMTSGMAVPPLRAPAMPLMALTSHDNAGLGFAFDVSAVRDRTGQVARRFNPAHPLLIQMTYDPLDLGDIDVSTLRIAYFDPVNSSWWDLPTTVDRVQNVLTATTTHFTLFQVRATARTRAQLQRVQARLAALAAAGVPQVTILRPTQSSLDGVPLLISVPSGRQRPPLNVQITGAPGARVEILFIMSTVTVRRRLVLDARGYTVTGFAPTPPLTVTQAVRVIVTVRSGAVSRTVVQTVILGPGLATLGLPTPVLRVRLLASHARAGVAGPILVVSAPARASVRVQLTSLGKALTGVGPIMGTTDSQGALTLRLPSAPLGVVPLGTANKPGALLVQAVVTVSLRGWAAHATLTYRLSR